MSTQLTRDPCILHNSHSDYSLTPRPSHPSVCLLQSDNFKSICQHWQEHIKCKEYNSCNIIQSTPQLANETQKAHILEFWSTIYIATFQPVQVTDYIYIVAVGVSKTWSKTLPVGLMDLKWAWDSGNEASGLCHSITPIMTLVLGTACFKYA